MARKGRLDVRHVPARTTAVVLICRKCCKKLGGGFGPEGDERLARALRRRQASGGRRTKPRKSSIAVLEVGCLDLCPKGGVAVLHGGRPGDWLVVARGTALDVVEAHLGLERMKGEA